MKNPRAGSGRRIDRTGMSDIYRLKTPQGTRAVKVARNENPVFQDAALNEAHVLTAIGPHPNIIHCHGAE